MAQVKVIKCLQFRIYPDAAQQVLIWKTFGCCRWMWNHLLDERIKSNKVLDGVKFKNTTPAHFKKIPENSFLKEVDALALANEQLNVNRACSKCFAKGKTPKFRAKRNERRSYTTNAVNNNIELIHIRDTENYLKLPKLRLVKIIRHRNIPDGAVLKHVTVKETASGKFFAALTYEVMQEEVQPVTEFKDVESFDYNMRDLVVSASGRYDIQAEDIHWYRKMEQKLAKEERRLSHMEYGSNHYRKQKHRVGAIHEKIANRRNDFLHNLSRDVADEFDAVAVEDINLHGMAQALNFGKSIHDNGFGRFRGFLAYKLKAQGKALVKVSWNFPSTQRCSVCHHINSKVKDLSVREWVCPSCGALHNRDKNACANLKQEAINYLNRWANGDSTLILTPEGVLSVKKPHLLKGGE
ncbi:RNA-guided endonuclease TnpB family protein [uncultured Succinatimonas sp.]|uniref:RNA-guided endonuclease TnpB family protein n=1 Tax=uncultured Succinatimonas sp. TaxID=1262973 RepID=UPI0025E7E464|nr:RNA-guided endonuclease TnpB family protein [uncultured Succinatimonas sp.]